MTAATRYDGYAGFGVLTLDRPEIRNTLTGDTVLDEILTTLDRLEADPEVRVLVITGSGPAFSAGGDVKAMEARTGLFSGDPEQITEAYRTTIQRLTRRMLATDLVTIAAVNGAAVGAGFDLALGCDLRIGAPTARFAHTFVDLGILPGDGGAWLLPRVVGWQRAAEIAFTARMIEAVEAERIGILLEIVEADRLLTRALELAEIIAGKPAHSVRLTKRLLRHARTMDPEGFLEFTAALQAVAHHTQAHTDAVTSYVARLEQRSRG